jgi:guanylate kinase
VKSEDYTPSKEVLSYLKQVDFVGVVGPTAVGKSTLIERALRRDKHGLHLVRSTVSRTPRAGEEDGVDMHFRARKDMERRIAKQDYATLVSVFDNLYATAPEDYASEGISIMPLIADAAPIFQEVPFHTFRTVFVLPPSAEEWQNRIHERRMLPDQLQKRLSEAASSLIFACESPDVVFVLNDDIDVATEAFLGALYDNDIDADQQKACRHLARELLTELTTQKDAFSG